MLRYTVGKLAGILLGFVGFTVMAHACNCFARRPRDEQGDERKEAPQG